MLRAEDNKFLTESGAGTGMGELLRRLGRGDQARTAYDTAIELAGNTAETAHLTRRRDQLGPQ